MNKNQIFNKIKNILAGIEDSLEDDAKIAMVRGFWQIGQLATEHKKTTGMLIQDIAIELDIRKGALQRYTQFYQTFPQGYPEKYFDRVVNWTYICSILPVHDKKAREFYLKEACRLGWSKYELLRRIKEGYYYESYGFDYYPAKNADVGYVLNYDFSMEIDD